MTTVCELNSRTLHTLVGWEAPLFVSVFIPVDFSRPQATNALAKALRHAAQTAAIGLTNRHGMMPSVAATFVAPLTAETIVDDTPRSAHGLAVFLSADCSLSVALPIEVGPAVEIGDRVDMLRLLPAVVDDVKYFVLTIDKQGAKLFHGTRFGFEAVEVPDMPGSIDDALWYIRREPSLNRQGSGVTHGTGGGQDLRKDDVRQYIHLIDKAITPVLAGSDAPLVVVGVEYEAAMFINHTHYRNTIDIPICGSPDSMSPDDLHRRSWDFAQSQARSTRDALERFQQLAGTGKTSTDPNEIDYAGGQGSISDLLVAKSATNPGETPQLSTGGRPEIVAAVNEGLRHRTSIHVVDDNCLPNGIRIAAVLRY
ncbi:MAG: hypothetical protein ABI862_05795 [Ilumatobacteraceae bacterium]